jgi:hypothetical protein
MTLSRPEVQRSQVLQQVALSGLTLKKLSYQEAKRLWGRFLLEELKGAARTVAGLEHDRASN